MENLILLILTLFILFFFFYFVTGQDLLTPPNIMVLMFLLSSFFALLNADNWNIEYHIKTYLIIISGIIAFFLPFYVIYKRRKKDTNSTECISSRYIEIRRWKIVLSIVIDLIILFLYYSEITNIVRASGYSGQNIQWYFRNLTSLESSVSISGWLRILIKFIDASTYICCYVFINNNLIYKNRKRGAVLYIVPAVLFCIKALMGGGRQDLLKLISFFIVVTYILNMQKYGWKKNISVRYIFIGILTLMLALPGFHYALALAGRSTTRTMFQAISTYVGGPIQHFNQYIVNPIGKSEFWGNETFTPILNTLSSLGIIDYHNTVHLEFRQLGVTKGNVYTFFRRPLQDFGIGGMYIFTVLVSCFFSIYYIYKIKYKRVNLKQDFNVIIYSYLLYWIVLSSIEQYSMTIISIQTLLMLIILYFFWKFYFYVDIKQFVIKIRRKD